MPYKGSYVWKIRQKVGSIPLAIPAAEAVVVRDDGKILMVYNTDFDNWTIPGGYVEIGQNSADCAARELLEEAGIIAKAEDMIPAQFRSGYKLKYKNGDVTYPFVQLFVTHKWRDSGDDNRDVSEVNGRKWMSISEAKKCAIAIPDVDRIRALERFLATGEYQIISYNDEA